MKKFSVLLITALFLFSTMVTHAAPANLSRRDIKGTGKPTWTVKEPAPEPALEPAPEPAPAPAPELEPNVTAEPAPERDTTSVVEVPAAFLEENATELSKKLEAFLADNSGKTVIFPANETFVVDRTISLKNVQNMEIDFNHSTITVPDHYDGGWESNVLSIAGVKSITISNLGIDGNKHNVSIESRVIGITIRDATDVHFENVRITDTNYKAIVVNSNTKTIHFELLYLKDNYGSKNSSDVYVNNSTYDSLSFNDVMAERSTLSGDQVFYINGYNTAITNLRAYNIDDAVLDYRKGKHYADHINIDSCGATVHLQTTSNTEHPEVVVKNLNGTELYGMSHTKAALGVWASTSSYFENIHLSFRKDTPNNWYGVVIREFNGTSVVNNVHFKNLTIENTSLATIHYNNMSSKTLVENLTVIPTAGHMLRAEFGKAEHTITNIIAPGISKVYDPDNKLIYNFL